MAEAEDRSEAATPRRLQLAREEGRFAISREVSPLLLLGAAALLLTWALPPAATGLGTALATLVGRADVLTPAEAGGLAMRAAVPTLLPFAGIGILCGLLAGFGQTGFSFRLEALRPSFGKLNLWRNLGRISGRGALLELGRSLLKAALAGYALWLALGTMTPWLGVSLLWTPAALLDRLGRLAVRLLLAGIAAQLLVTTVDVAWTRWSYARSLRMDRQEIRDEMREAEGDPQVRARIRRLRLVRARKRMLAAVARATVVVTNPTHYAVALAYERGRGGAPRVVAKGVDAMAARIRELAIDARVPIVVNPPLAQALWRIELDSEIPAVMFQAVAEIIAYVWRLRTPGARAGRGGP